ncbi:putative inner membrane protein [Salmonella enterica subsp. enterica serovar Tennessee str. 4535]|nr:putative inner membrane protein [Salmonella enterica subsp. enterica serovar Tennessee str. 4535]
MYIYGSKKTEKTGLWINRKLNSKFGIDIELGAVKRGNKITPIPTLILYLPMEI